jgi:hypothetical protein
VPPDHRTFYARTGTWTGTGIDTKTGPPVGSAPVGTAYLLHFEQRYEHAGHYTGWTTDLDKRLLSHAAGKGPRDGGARLIQVIREAGIGFLLARTWPGVTRRRERQLKESGGASRYCPVCQNERRLRGEPRRLPKRLPAHAIQPPRVPEFQSPGRQGPAGRQPVAEFLALNPAFARPTGASQAKQWSRVRGREAIEALGPRVIAAWFEENQQPQQQRFAAIQRRGRQAVVQERAQARQHRREQQAEQTRPQVLPERTRQQLTSQRLASARQSNAPGDGPHHPAHPPDAAAHPRAARGGRP